MQFRAHKNLSLEMVRRVGDRVKRFTLIRGLALGLVRMIQVLAVQAMKLYWAELLWNGKKG